MKKRKYLTKCACSLAFLLTLTSGLAGCAEKPFENLPKTDSQKESLSGGQEDTSADSSSQEDQASLPAYIPVDPDTVAENSAGDFTYEEYYNGKGITITSYTGTSAQVKIPSQIDGKDVICISEDAFRGNDTITYVYIPDSVTQLEKSVFQNCSNLEEVRIPPVSIIPYGFMAKCTSLKYLEIPEGCEHIGKGNDTGSFSECKSLTAVKFPSTLKYIHANSFSECNNLKSIDLSSTSLEFLGQLSFSYCYNMKSAALPATLVSLESNAFTGCTALSDITVAEGNPELESVDGLIYLEGDELLMRAPAHSNVDVIIRDGTTKIHFAAFKYNLNLKSVVIPDSVTIMERQAFLGCSQLESVTLGKGLDAIYQSVFEECSLISIEIPDNIKKLYGNAFANCMYLENVSLPDEITYFSDDNSESVFKYDKKVNITYKGNTYTYDQLSDLDAAINNN